MLNKRKRFIIGMATAATCFLTVAGISLNASKTEAQAQSAFQTVAFNMDKGASVRLTSSELNNGLKFTAYMSKADYESVETESVSYGVLIVPYDYIENGYEITVDNVFGKTPVYSSAETLGTGQKRIVNLSCDEMTLDKDDAGRYLVQGSITDILTKNLTREFFGLAYMTNGTDYRFADYTEGENVRSMVYVAQLALEDDELTEAQKERVKAAYTENTAVTSLSSSYTVNYYKEKSDGTYDVTTNTVTGNINSAVTVQTSVEDGYSLDEKGSRLSGVIYANQKAVFNVYYNLSRTFTYDLTQSGAFVNGTLPTEISHLSEDFVLPSALCEGYIFEGWYDGETEDANRVEKISADSNDDVALYAKFTASNAKVILLAGQSNAVGYTYNENLEKTAADKYAEYETGYANVQIKYYNDVSAGGSGGNVSDGFVNVTVGQGRNENCFGAELGIAETLASQYPNEIVYIIKTAWGGTRLYDEWSSPSSGDIPGSAYSHFITATQEGIELLKDKGLTPEIRALCWVQGESDCASYVDSYKAKLSNLADDVRTEFADVAAPNGISFVDVGVSVSGRWENYEEMNQIKQEYADSANINYYISSDELIASEEGNPADGTIDPVHYDSLSMLELGTRFGNVLAEILQEDEKAVSETLKGVYKSQETLVWDKFTDKTPKVLSGTNYYGKELSVIAEGTDLYVKYVTNYKSGDGVPVGRGLRFDLDNSGGTTSLGDLFVYINLAYAQCRLSVEENTVLSEVHFSHAAHGVQMYMEKAVADTDVTVYLKIDVTKFGLTAVSEQMGVFDVSDPVWSNEKVPDTYQKIGLVDGVYYSLEQYNAKKALAKTVVYDYTATGKNVSFALAADDEYIYFMKLRNQGSTKEYLHHWFKIGDYYVRFGQNEKDDATSARMAVQVVKDGAEVKTSYTDGFRFCELAEDGSGYYYICGIKKSFLQDNGITNFSEVGIHNGTTNDSKSTNAVESYYTVTLVADGNGAYKVKETA